jgi:hypothetical protein
MFRTARTILVSALVIVLAVFLLRKADLLPSFRDFFASKPVTIDQTPVIVANIRELAQLVTLTAYDEVVADSMRLGPADILVHALTIPGASLITPDHIVLVGKGRVMAGIDLKLLKEGDIHPYKDSISISLPAASILEVVMNPSDFDTFIESGNWTPDAVTRVKVKAREMLTRRALEQGIIPKAQARGELLLGNFFRAAGFGKVTFLK